MGGSAYNVLNLCAQIFEHCRIRMTSSRNVFGRVRAVINIANTLQLYVHKFSRFGDYAKYVIHGEDVISTYTIGIGLLRAHGFTTV